MITFAGPALPMDDVPWMACTQAALDAMMLRDHLPLDQALHDVPRRMRQLFGDALAPGVAEAAVVEVYLSTRSGR